MNRRTFLKASAATAAVAAGKPGLGAIATKNLRAIPSLADLASVRMRHGFMDLFNLPIAMNDWGYAQTVKSVTGLSAIAFPPYACCGVPDVAWSPGYLRTCELFINGKFAALSDDPAQAVTYQWFPHRVVREQSFEGLQIRTTVFLPSEMRAVVQDIEVRNEDSATRNFTLEFDMRGGVIHKGSAWFNELPGEGDNRLTWSAGQGRLTFAAQHSAAACVQGIHPPAGQLTGGNVLRYELQLRPGEKQDLHFVATVVATAAEAEAMHDRLQTDFARLDQQNESLFDHLVQSAFTPGNGTFSGHLPQLKTESETLWNLYNNGLKNLLTARRRSPDSVYGPTLLTLSGHVLPTLSFPWDTALSSLSLALLDPLPLRQLAEVWFERDMHQHLATDYISGEAIGPWYGVNDMAIVRCAQNYLRVTGDFAWLERKVGDRIVLDHLYDHATYWKKLIKGGNGLADYGEISNLLEVVSTYLHEVAGMNAGNVSSMRFVADLLERRGLGEDAAKLRSDASDLAARINRLLYVEGKGWWRCGQPDGSFNEVRHCYDFLAVLDNMSQDLAENQKREMAHYFWSQLASKKWMRALASADPDATWNVRPDHSCLGAYAAWPAMCAKGLLKIDNPATVAAWLSEVAKAGNQGPIGQAHFTEDVVPPLQGGACKASEDAPYIEDWCCIAGGTFTELVIDSIFGVNFGLYDGLRATPRLRAFDPGACLENLHYQGAEYSADATGVKRMG
jgi:TAT (twin-arginine translocation) pathway signal sequence